MCIFILGAVINIRNPDQYDNLTDKFLKKSGLSQNQIDIVKEGIDFTKHVIVLKQVKGTRFVQYHINGTRGNFYSYPCQSPDNLGISSVEYDKQLKILKNKKITNYVLNKDTEMLVSYSKEIYDTWSVPGQKVYSAGGGLQFYTTCAECFDEI